MKSKVGKLWIFCCKSRSSHAAFLAIVFVCGSLLPATAQRNAPVQVSNQSLFSARTGLSGGIYASGLTVIQQKIYCASDDMKRHWCNINTSGGVRLVKQKSDSACIRGQTWGSNRNGIWVDRGCRADFQVGGY